jgi:hypothetical protein
MHVGHQITVALPSSPDVHWQNGVQLSTSTPGPGDEGSANPSAVLPSGAASSSTGNAPDSGASSGQPATTLAPAGPVLQRNSSHTSPTSATFRALHAGVVVLYADAIAQCPNSTSMTNGPCTPGARVWSVVVSVQS